MIIRRCPIVAVRHSEPMKSAFDYALLFPDERQTLERRCRRDTGNGGMHQGPAWPYLKVPSLLGVNMMLV